MGITTFNATSNPPFSTGTQLASSGGTVVRYASATQNGTVFNGYTATYDELLVGYSVSVTLAGGASNSVMTTIVYVNGAVVAQKQNGLYLTSSGASIYDMGYELTVPNYISSGAVVTIQYVANNVTAMSFILRSVPVSSLRTF